MRRLLSILSDGRFHSGQDLGNCLEISRSAVWKKIAQLRSDWGLTIHSVPGRGYCLVDPPLLLDESELRIAAETQNWTFQLYDRVDSTNTVALRSIQKNPDRPILVMSEFQSAGKGRRGRTWISPVAGENIFFSLALRLENKAFLLSGLSLVVGLAVLRTLQHIGLCTLGLKWPNDVYANNRKIAGILLELTGNPVDICYVVIGIGLNVNIRLEDNAASIDQPWTSVRHELKKTVSRTELTKTLMSFLKSYMDRHAVLGFEGFKTEWESHHLWQGKSCVLDSGTSKFEGIVLGVDREGGLRFVGDNGEQIMYGGELSLRLAL